jgi:hypothetical protein
MRRSIVMSLGSSKIAGAICYGRSYLANPMETAEDLIRDEIPVDLMLRKRRTLLSPQGDGGFKPAGATTGHGNGE